MEMDRKEISNGRARQQPHFFPFQSHYIKILSPHVSRSNVLQLDVVCDYMLMGLPTSICSIRYRVKGCRASHRIGFLALDWRDELRILFSRSGNVFSFQSRNSITVSFIQRKLDRARSISIETREPWPGNGSRETVQRDLGFFLCGSRDWGSCSRTDRGSCCVWAARAARAPPSASTSTAMRPIRPNTRSTPR